MHLDATFFALVALLIFFGIVIYVGGFRKIGDGLDNRALRIRKELDDAMNLRKEAEALLNEYREKRLAAEKEALSIIAQARADADEYAAETRRKLSESIERRTRQAEQKIAQAEANAVKDVRNAVAEIAVAAAASLTAGQVKAGKAGDLIADSIAAVKAKLN